MAAGKCFIFSTLLPAGDLEARRTRIGNQFELTRRLTHLAVRLMRGAWPPAAPCGSWQTIADTDIMCK